MAETFPRQFGRYELQGVVLRDGFGTIYRAHDTHYDRDVWVRVLDGDLASDPATSEQFRRAARLAASLSHPNLPLVYEVGEADGLPFLSFRPAEGVTLSDRLRAESPIFPLRAAFIVSQIADALQYLNERWLSHGNLQDRSVWLSDDDQVTLLDFGMALGVHTPEKDAQALANLAHEMVVGAPFSRTDATMRRPGIPWRRAEDRLGPEMWQILMRGVGYEGKPFSVGRGVGADVAGAALWGRVSAQMPPPTTAASATMARNAAAYRRGGVARRRTAGAASGASPPRTRVARRSHWRASASLGFRCRACPASSATRSHWPSRAAARACWAKAWARRRCSWRRLRRLSRGGGPAVCAACTNASANSRKSEKGLPSYPTPRMR
ncbi:MAG: protein kinase, partial [Chloroflexi bacterium]|nr:protein kinase [Chloroflexota bacterium]